MVREVLFRYPFRGLVAETAVALAGEQRSGLRRAPLEQEVPSPLTRSRPWENFVASLNQMRATLSMIARSAFSLLLFFSFLETSSAAPKKPDFSGFTGRYRGDVVVRVGGSVAMGNTKITATAPQRGKSLRLRLLGVLTEGGLSQDYAGTMQFGSTLRYWNDSADFNVSANASPVTGLYHFRKRDLLFRGLGTLNSGERIRIDGRAAFPRKGRLLRMRYRIVFPEQDNQEYRFEFTATRTRR